MDPISRSLTLSSSPPLSGGYVGSTQDRQLAAPAHLVQHEVRVQDGLLAAPAYDDHQPPEPTAPLWTGRHILLQGRKLRPPPSPPPDPSVNRELAQGSHRRGESTQAA